MVFSLIGAVLFRPAGSMGQSRSPLTPEPTDPQGLDLASSPLRAPQDRQTALLVIQRSSKSRVAVLLGNRQPCQRQEPVTQASSNARVYRRLDRQCQALLLTINERSETTAGTSCGDGRRALAEDALPHLAFHHCEPLVDD